MLKNKFFTILFSVLLVSLCSLSVFTATDFFSEDGNFYCESTEDQTLGRITGDSWNSKGTYLQPNKAGGQSLFLYGSSKAIYFGTTPNSYGFRDNSGIMQYKNDGGIWEPLGSGGSSQWATTTDGIYYSSGNVTVGSTTDATYMFTVGATTSERFIVDEDGVIVDGIWNGEVISDAYITKTGDWAGTWDGYATNTLPYTTNALASGLIFIGNGAGVAEASTSPYLLLAGGTMTGNIEMGSNDIKGIDEIVIASSTLGTVTSGVWNGTAIDFSTYTNATGGRSITLNSDAIDADTEIYTDFFTWNDKDVAKASSTSPEGVKYFGQATTITIAECACDTGSTTLQFDERTEPYAVGTDILSSALTCDDVASTTSFASASIAADNYVGIEVLTLTGTPTQCAYTLKYTYDD